MDRLAPFSKDSLSPLVFFTRGGCVVVPATTKLTKPAISMYSKKGG
jgi:hypothetical protein